MKLMAVFFFVVITNLIASDAYSQITKLTIHLADTPVKEVLREIETNSDFLFLYNSKLVDVDRIVSLDVNDKNISEILSDLFKETDVVYAIIDQQIVLTNKAYQLGFVQAINRQPEKITGTVLDQQGLPLPGVYVVVTGTTQGVITDIAGKYSIDIPQGAGSLTFTFIGMESQEIIIGTSSVIDVTMIESVIGLDEVVVIGYGVQKKKLVTGATTQVSGENLQKMITHSPLGALQSQTPGVNITQNSGQPGESFKVTIRGLGTVNNSSPLYVIDGVAGGDINTLNPSDIESIDVLKDAASSAIYGARAANGVILVTTKRGKEGKMQFTYDGYYGIQNPYKVPPVATASEYMAILDEVNANEGLAPYDWSTLIPELYQRVQNGWKGTHWLNKIENPNAPIQNHAFNILGGKDISKFSIGLSYTNQEGIYGNPVEPNYKRYTVRINSDHVILKKGNMDVIKLGENFNYSYNDKNGIGIGGIYNNTIRNMLVAPPLMPVYNDEGEYFSKDDLSTSGLDNIDPGFTNPIAFMVYTNGYNLSKNYAMNMNAYIEIQPLQNLIFRSSYGHILSGNTYRSYIPEYDLSSTTLNTIDKVSQSASLGHRWTWENTLAYSFSVNNHAFSALVGQSLEKWGMGESLSGTNGNSLFNSFEYAWLDNTPTYMSGVTQWRGSPWGEGGIASFFGRVNYNFKETYLLSLVMRTDGSSNFARGNRWGYFPSASAGWVVSNESFFKNAFNWIDFLKLRISWGQNGNADIDNFQYLATIAFDDANAYSFGNSKDTQSTGGYADILPNEDITWETSEQLNFGFDARFANSRLGMAFDWYKKTTKDWLVQAPTLASYGTGAPYINGGDVENKGIELALDWRDRFGDLTYSANLNASYNKNKVTRIANGEGIIHGPTGVLFHANPEIYRAEVGKPIGYFWGYKTAGVFQNQQEIDATEVFLQDDPQPGDLIFVDANNDGEINSDDKVEIGNPHPDFMVGFSFNIAYKGFDLAVITNGAFGQQIAKSYRGVDDNKFHNYTTDIFKRWHGEGTSNRLPRLCDGSNVNWEQVSDIYIEDADYLKLQNITLGYNLKKLIKVIPFEQARFFITAQNLYTFTKYSGQDPEIGFGSGNSWASGIDLGFYPSPRTFLAGFNLKF